jgi:hypothetical protein
MAHTSIVNMDNQLPLGGDGLRRDVIGCACLSPSWTVQDRQTQNCYLQKNSKVD